MTLDQPTQHEDQPMHHALFIRPASPVVPLLDQRFSAALDLIEADTSSHLGLTSRADGYLMVAESTLGDVRSDIRDAFVIALEDAIVAITEAA